jgi:hypothetical protein
LHGNIDGSERKRAKSRPGIRPRWSCEVEGAAPGFLSISQGGTGTERKTAAHSCEPWPWEDQLPSSAFLGNSRAREAAPPRAGARRRHERGLRRAPRRRGTAAGSSGLKGGWAREREREGWRERDYWRSRGSCSRVCVCVVI